MRVITSWYKSMWLNNLKISRTNDAVKERAGIVLIQFQFFLVEEISCSKETLCVLLMWLWALTQIRRKFSNMVEEIPNSDNPFILGNKPCLLKETQSECVDFLLIRDVTMYCSSHAFAGNYLFWSSSQFRWQTCVANRKINPETISQKRLHRDDLFLTVNLPACSKRDLPLFSATDDDNHQQISIKWLYIMRQYGVGDRQNRLYALRGYSGRSGTLRTQTRNTNAHERTCTKHTLREIPSRGR